MKHYFYTYSPTTKYLYENHTFTFFSDIPKMYIYNSNELSLNKKS